MKAGIETYGLEGLAQLMESLGQPNYRELQLAQWLYEKGAKEYSEMSNLPAELREQLETAAPLCFPEIVNKQVSVDGTRKYVLRFSDGSLVETVGIPSYGQSVEGEIRRLTVCFSTQVGCGMGCQFCATAREGFARNLQPGEMLWQLLTVQQDFQARISNVVAMGQGEPFANYENTLAALRYMNHNKILNIGARHISISTCGLADGIRALGHEPEQFVLAISLHSAIQAKRNKLMPGLRKVPLSTLKDALCDYQSNSGRRISLEYLMINNLNSTTEDLRALQQFCQDLHIHVNLLPINTIKNSSFTPCSEAHMQTWITQLQQAGIEASLRHSRGADINGACGQLKNAL